jgi:hypothetical protein
MIRHRNAMLFCLFKTTVLPTPCSPCPRRRYIPLKSCRNLQNAAPTTPQIKCTATPITPDRTAALSRALHSPRSELVGDGYGHTPLYIPYMTRCVSQEAKQIRIMSSIVLLQRHSTHFASSAGEVAEASSRERVEAAVVPSFRLIRDPPRSSSLPAT